jgi:flagellar export protein FliJ
MAKRFTFRLETLLRLRRQREDEQKRVVASRLRQIRTIEQHRHNLEDRIAEHTEAMRHLLGLEQADVDQLKVGRHWMIRLRRGMLEAEAALAAHRALLAQERVKMAETRKDTKVFERLKEKQREAFLTELERRDRAESDDFNVTRFAHVVLSEDAEES